VLEIYQIKLKKTLKIIKDVLLSILNVTTKAKKLKFVVIVQILKEKDLISELNQSKSQKD